MRYNLLLISVLSILVATACTGLEYDPPQPELVIEVTIEAPQDGSTVSNPVELSASGVDEIGGDISFLTEWTSDVDETLGTGATLDVTLSEGEHTITAVIDDGQGRRDEDTITIQVE